MRLSTAEPVFVNAVLYRADRASARIARIGDRRMRSLSQRKCALAIFTILLWCGRASCQETINFASISGRVLDASGAVVPGATVIARQTETNISSTTTSNNEGLFRFPYLKTGPYEVEVQHTGFGDATTNVSLSVGSSAQMTIQLRVAKTEEKITVSSQATTVETGRTQIEGTITPQEVANMPLNGRNFLDLTTLVPGVTPTNTNSTQLFPETSAVPGQGISVNSQRNFSNSFIVDGLSANDDAAGLAGTFYALGAVKEFQVVTSGGQAEYGRALGGYVNKITRSGTDQTHGEVYGFLRNQDLNAANGLSGTTLPLTQTQYGASLGGPIVKDKTFYFANFEQRLLNQDGLITVSPSNVEAINSTLLAVGYPGSLIATGLYPNPVHYFNFLGKIDQSFSPRDLFSIRYSVYDVNSANSRFTGGLTTASGGAALSDVDQTVAISNVYTVSPQTVNETRGQFTNSNLKAPANDNVGPAVSISGVATFGTASGSPTARYDRLFEVADNLSHQIGAHSLRVGAEFLYNDLTITYPRSVNGSYSFSSLASFENGIYTTYTQTFGNPVVGQTNPNVGFYVQDEWRALPQLTINAGVRYDLQFLQTINTDAGNVSPRLGIAWSPYPSRKTVVRASAGLYYDRVPLRPLANALLSSDNTTDLATVQQQSVSLAFGQVGAPVFPFILQTVPSNVLISLTTMSRDLQNAYSEQASLEIEQQIGNSSTFSVNYQHVRGLHLLMSVNQNVPACSSKVDPVNLCRPNPTYQNDSEYSGAGQSQYDGLTVSFLQRPAKWGSVRVSYTWSKALDDVGEFFFSSPINNFNVYQDWGRSDDDQRHRVVVDGYVYSSTGPAHDFWQQLTHGWQLGGILQYYSALPFNVVSGVNTIQQTTGRPCSGLPATSPDCTLSDMIGRNAGTGFDYFSINTRLSRTFPLGERFKLQTIAEVFNLLNRNNYLIPNTTFGTGIYPFSPRNTFGQPTAIGDPREVQFALRLTF